jgi:leucine-rich PPR motif-containing protein
MASGLVDLLKEAHVTSGAQGIAYSCLIDVLVARGRAREALERLTAGLGVNGSSGLSLEDVNRTALMRLKSAVESEGLTFGFAIPKKCNSSKAHRPTSSAASIGDDDATYPQVSEERSLSPLMD